MEVEARVWISAEITRAAEPAIGAELALAQQLMARSRRFGWITSASAGLQLTAPSRPVCALLGIPREHLTGSYVIGDPLVGRLETILANYGEWLLIIGMLVHSVVQHWRQVGQAEHLARADAFFARIGRYVHEHYAQVVQQISAAPHIVADHEPREVLQQCLAAALGSAPWPAYNPNLWNSIRMYVQQHPLLPPGAVARFVKTARPLSLHTPIGFEVTWEPEDADDVAHQLMRDILQQLPPVEALP